MLKNCLFILLLFFGYSFCVSIISSDASLSTPNQCDGRPIIQEWIKQRKQIKIENDLLQVIISKNFNDDLKRLVNSAEIYQQPYVILGLCEESNGENLLSHFLETIKQTPTIQFEKLLILFSTPSSLFVSSPKELSHFYLENYPDGTMLFKAEKSCFPSSLESQYKSTHNFRFLSSQAFLAPARELVRLFKELDFQAPQNEPLEVYSQQYFSLAFLTLREKFKMQIDSNKKVFASLFGKDDSENFLIKNKNGINKLIWRSFDSVTNDITESTPILVSGLPFSFLEERKQKQKQQLDSDDASWVKNLQKEDYEQVNLKKEQIITKENIISEIDSKFNLGLLQNFFPSTETFQAPFSSSSDYNTLELKANNKILIALFLSDDDIFARLLFEGIENLDYEKSNIVLLVNYKRTSKRANPEIVDWIEKVSKTQGTPGNYLLVIKSFEMDLRKAKREAMMKTLEHECDYYFTTDAVLENVDTLSHLINERKRLITPMMTLHDSTYSNFWGEINWEKQGFQKNFVYTPVVKREYKGVLRVPVVWGSFLIHSSLLTRISGNYLSVDSTRKSEIDWDVLLDKMNRYAKSDDWWIDLVFIVKSSYELDEGIWISNKEHFGYLIDKDDLPPNAEKDEENGRVHKELYAYSNNKYLFKKYYYSEDFFNFIHDSQPSNYTEVCPDAYAWVFMRTHFGEHLIEEAENYGNWSGGGHKQSYDPRIGGTENYPTQDIHLNQFGLHDTWLDIVKTDIAHLADTIYGGLTTKGINIAFIVRYKPGAQSFLKPHNDASLYTIDVALNKPGRDFEGGGVRYVRRNCTYIPPEPGYSIIHPGRLTHKHEGLRTISGTRYILVTFID